MQSSDWVTLVTKLTALGFSYVLHFELSCPTCGDWRSACLADSEFRPTCPRCGELGDLAILGRGLTKAEIGWKLISPALPASYKREGSYDGNSSRYARVMSRKRCEKFFARARRELAGIR
jgi:hypothetical protein